MNEQRFLEAAEMMLEAVTHRLLDNEPVKAYTAVMEVRNSIIKRVEKLSAEAQLERVK